MLNQSYQDYSNHFIGQNELEGKHSARRPMLSVHLNTIDAITAELLTTREREVFNCLLNGRTAKESAKDLFISPRTVERHLENLRKKLNCRNKFELVGKVLNGSKDARFSNGVMGLLTETT